MYYNGQGVAKDVDAAVKGKMVPQSVGAG